MRLVFQPCDAARAPASELIEAVLVEYDALAGRPLRGGPSATPADFSPPGGAYIVGFVDGAPACGGGIKGLGDGVAELKRMYVTPQLRRHGLGSALLQAWRRPRAASATEWCAWTASLRPGRCT